MTEKRDLNPQPMILTTTSPIWVTGQELDERLKEQRGWWSMEETYREISGGCAAPPAPGQPGSLSQDRLCLSLRGAPPRMSFPFL